MISPAESEHFKSLKTISNEFLRIPDLLKSSDYFLHKIEKPLLPLIEPSETELLELLSAEIRRCLLQKEAIIVRFPGLIAGGYTDGKFIVVTDQVTGTNIKLDVQTTSDKDPQPNLGTDWWVRASWEQDGKVLQEVKFDDHFTGQPGEPYPFFGYDSISAGVFYRYPTKEQLLKDYILSIKRSVANPALTLKFAYETIRSTPGSVEVLSPQPTFATNNPFFSLSTFRQKSEG